MDQYIVISSDCHAGLPGERYREYLDPQYRDTFDQAYPLQVQRIKAAEKAFLEGDSPDMVKAQYASRPKPDSPLKQLYAERDRLEKSLETLTKKIAEIERRINDFETKRD